MSEPAPLDATEPEKKKKNPLWVILILLLMIGLAAVATMFFTKGTPVGTSELVSLNAGDLSDDDSIKAFIRRFIETGEDNGPAAELSFYAEQVDEYFGKPDFDKAKILEDRTRFVEKWPTRTYELIGDPEIVAREGDIVIAQAKFRYAVANDTTKATDREGQAFYRIRQRGSDLEIFWINEEAP